MVFCEAQKFEIFDEVQLIFLFSVCYSLVGFAESKVIRLLIFSSKSFVVLFSYFRSGIHFELILYMV